jgi:hypothetical protein
MTAMKKRATIRNEAETEKMKERRKYEMMEAETMK